MDKRVGSSVEEGGGKVKSGRVYGLAAFRRVGPEALLPLLACEGVFLLQSRLNWVV